MSEIKKYPDGVTDIEFSSGSKIAFAGSQIEGVLKDRKKVHDFLRLVKEVDAKRQHGAAAWEGDTTVISVGGLNPEKWQKGETFYYRAQFNGQPYFIKRLSAAYGEGYGGGHKELMDSREARELIGDLENVEVVEYVMGYESKKDWYFVSKWNDAFQVTLDEYLNQLKTEIRKNPSQAEELENVYDEILDRVRAITKRLRPSYEDVMTYNMAYDPASKKIFLFDLNKKKQETMKVE